MLPNVYQILSGDAAVFAIVGNRIYMHGEAQQGGIKPYIVWQSVSGIPENTLNCEPKIDFWAIQIDCYHSSQSGVVDLIKAVRNAMQSEASITAFTANERDFETRLYRMALTTEWWYSRT